jgi:hypothetical protein
VSAKNLAPEAMHSTWNIRTETHLCPPQVDAGAAGILELRNTALRRNGLSTLDPVSFRNSLISDWGLISTLDIQLS